MPTFIPDKLKTPGDFPSVDANDNQIRGFGFFDSASTRDTLAEPFRCEGYLAFMRDSDQFKQYNSSDLTEGAWTSDANWDLLEGTTTDTYWSADGDGSGIYYSGQVVVGASTYSGDEDFYVSGTAKVTTSLETPAIKTSSGLDIVINTDETDTASDDFVVKYGVVGSGGTIRNVLDISPYAPTPNIAFGNISDDFKLDHYSSSFSEFRTLSGNGNETGFKFTDAYGGDGSFLIRMKNDASYFEMKDGGRDLTVTPHFYKIKSTVEANSTVTHPVEMLMPSTATGDWTFNHLGNKNFVFNTNTGSSEKLITKFHAAGNGVVSIGTANYYNEYNGIQYPSEYYSATLQPRLFIVNDGTSNVGVRVQSGDVTLGAEGLRTQPRYFTDMRDDGFYISRTSTGPRYDDTAVEGEEWDNTEGNPSAAIGMRRGPSNGNSLALFARNDLYFFSNGTSSAFQVNGDPNADTRQIKLWSPDNTSHIQIYSYNSSFTTVGAKFSIPEIGEFLIVKSNEPRITSGPQILSSTIRGAQFRVTNLGDPTLNLNPSLEVYSISGKSDNTGYWWGANGEAYNTQADLDAAGTTLATNKVADQLAIYVPKHGSGKVGIGTTSPRYGKLDVFGRIVSDAGNNTLPFLGYNMRNSDDVIVGMIGLGTAYNNVMVGGFNNGSVSIARHSADGEFDDEIMGHFDSTGLGLGTTSPSSKLHVVGQTFAQGVLKSSFGLQNNGDTDDMSIYNLTDNTGYIRLITTYEGNQREGLRVYNSGLTQVNYNLKFNSGNNASNSITVSRPTFTIGPADPSAETRIPTVFIGNGTYDANQFSISGSGSIFESDFLIGSTNYFGFRSPRSSGWIQTNPAKVLSVSVTDNVNGDVDTQFWATENGTATNYMTLHKDGKLSLDGDLEILSSSDGLILSDSSGKRYRITINTFGALVVAGI